MPRAKKIKERIKPEDMPGYKSFLSDIIRYKETTSKRIANQQDKLDNYALTEEDKKHRQHFISNDKKYLLFLQETERLVKEIAKQNYQISQVWLHNRKIKIKREERTNSDLVLMLNNIFGFDKLHKIEFNDKDISFVLKVWTY